VTKDAASKIQLSSLSGPVKLMLSSPNESGVHSGPPGTLTAIDLVLHSINVSWPVTVRLKKLNQEMKVYYV
jgi:hypothetical protein